MNEALYERCAKVYVFTALLFLAVCSYKPLMLFITADWLEKDLFRYKEKCNLSVVPAPYPVTSEKKKETEKTPASGKFIQEVSASKQSGNNFRSIEYPWKEWTDKNKKKIEDSVQSDFNFRDELSELNMRFRKIVGMEMPLSSDYTYVISGEKGHLLEVPSNFGKMKKYDFEKVKEKDIQIYIALSEISKKHNAGFLVAFPPEKKLFIPNTGRFKYLYDIKKAHLDVINSYAAKLQANKIPVVNLYGVFNSFKDHASDLFYLSDHHWNMRGAALGGKYIADALNRNFGCKYDLKYFDEKIFYKAVYEQIFIGSLGKKVNTPYMKQNKLEDFELWLPVFETQFSLEYLLQDKKYHGKFNIFYFEDHFKKEKNVYKKWCYMTFFNGDSPIIKITNHLTQNQQKVLIIKNSYANNMIPLLALQTKEIYMLDPRYRDTPDIFDYIAQIRPDIVIYFSCTDINSYLSTKIYGNLH